MRPDGNCRACMVEIKGERVLAPSCCRYPTHGHGGHDRQRARASTQQKMVARAAARRTCPETRLHARLRARSLGRRSSASASRASRRAQQPAADLSHPAMAVNLDACIQCTRCVRACREEQVNDVIGYAFRGGALEDRVRPRRPDGRLHLRRLRRMRAGVPDRRADAGARRRRWPCPTSRSTRCARTAASAASSPTTSRTTRSSTSRAATARPTTSRLCVKGRYGFDYVAPPASADQAADPQAPACRSTADFAMDPDELARRVPRSDLGRSARRSPAARLRDDPRHARHAALAGFGSAKGTQRRGLPVPEAGAHRLRLATTSTTARACATRRAWRR